MPRPTDRIIIDTNLWISYLLTKDPELDRLLENKLVTLLFSQDLILEFIEVAKLKKYFSSSDLEALLISLSAKAIFIEVLNSVNVAPDPKDNFLLALALHLIFNKMEPCLSNKEKATLPNTSHGLEYENPSEFNKVVLGFIDRH